MRRRRRPRSSEARNRTRSAPGPRRERLGPPSLAQALPPLACESPKLGVHLTWKNGRNVACDRPMHFLGACVWGCLRKGGGCEEIHGWESENIGFGLQKKDFVERPPGPPTSGGHKRAGAEEKASWPLSPRQFDRGRETLGLGEKLLTGSQLSWPRLCVEEKGDVSGGSGARTL